LTKAVHAIDGSCCYHLEGELATQCKHELHHSPLFPEELQKCLEPEPTTAPTQAPAPAPAPVGPNDPCARHPDAENDVVGNHVTLDESGYKVLASLDSPVNTKRFVCRVVEHINCKVVDFAGLMGFVPYYSGVAAHQTYDHLESELKMLCHAGGKWVVSA